MTITEAEIVAAAKALLYYEWEDIHLWDNLDVDERWLWMERAYVTLRAARGAAKR